MKNPPVNTADQNGSQLGPGTRRHCNGSASSTVVIMASRLRSSASGR